MFVLEDFWRILLGVGKHFEGIFGDVLKGFYCSCAGFRFFCSRNVRDAVLDVFCLGIFLSYNTVWVFLGFARTFKGKQKKTKEKRCEIR